MLHFSVRALITARHVGDSKLSLVCNDVCRHQRLEHGRALRVHYSFTISFPRILSIGFLVDFIDSSRSELYGLVFSLGRQMHKLYTVSEFGYWEEAWI